MKKVVPGKKIVQLGKEIEKAGVTIINTGIGWHESRIPTIVTSVPRAAFTWVTHKMKKEVSVPLITSNRINMPETAEKSTGRRSCRYDFNGASFF